MSRDVLKTILNSSWINTDGADLIVTWIETMPKVSIDTEERGHQGKETVFICAICEQ
jgi:hypothetical protein